MYQYSDFDRAFLSARSAAFRDAVTRRLDGTLTEDEFRPLRLQNGLYLMLHAYMLRVNIPYGTLSAHQMRGLADIADKFDRGYGHFTTRQNIQFNWPTLDDMPDILDALAAIDMHAVQSSGSCVRNVTSDHFAGAAADEPVDPRPAAELIRQWSTNHPEFAFLPRKFKIAVISAARDRAATKVHDIGIRIVHENGQDGYEVSVGGGLGRTPMIGKVLRPFLPKADLLPYLDAILRVYNLAGRRDNKYKARIKILVHEKGMDWMRAEVEAQFPPLKAAYLGGDQAMLAKIEGDFALPEFAPQSLAAFTRSLAQNGAFRSFVDTNTIAHKSPDHVAVTISLKAHGATPGDASSTQMRRVAELAERFGHNEIRVSHEQNLVLPHVHKGDLPEVYALLKEQGLATANIGLISDIIACPGMDYCDLATARSIPVAQDIALRFDELKLEHEIGPLKLKISGCINACGHHHVGHIGILGLEKGGVESYQITLGGDATETASLGQRVGPGFSADDILGAVETLIETYLSIRETPAETFLQTYRRLGAAPFKAALYPPLEEAQHAA